MIRFNQDFLENFLSVVRKYMQLRGGMSQKELSEATSVGISTMSRFLNLKTSTVDEQLVANLIATLGIPLHEIIDGVDEDSTDTMKRLVQFYKDQKSADEPMESGPGHDAKTRTEATFNMGGRKHSVPFGEATSTSASSKTDISIRDKLETLSPRQKAYLTDFLNLSPADRDLMVDLGDAVFRYFRQRNIQF